MSTRDPANRRLVIELPAEAFAHHPWDPDRLATELGHLWLLEQVRQRRLGFGKAAELSGLPQARFLELMRDHRITPFDLDPDELKSELA